MTNKIVPIEEVLEDKNSTLAYGHYTIQLAIRYSKHAKAIGEKLIIV